MSKPGDAEPPIPEPAGAGTALDYHDIPVDLSSKEAAEPLVDVADYGIASESFYARTDGLNAPYRRAFPSAPRRVHCRRGVAERLSHANASLKSRGVELFVLDAFRPVACQKELWNHFLAQAGLALPNGTAADHARYAGQYCSDPTGFDANDPKTWPTHATGGAVDLTLRRRDSGELSYMGGIFDDPTVVSHTRHYEARDDSASGAEARRNRRLLYWTMTGQGFANYAFEWWHFDWGTQMWVMNGGGSRAVYGPATLD